MESEINKYVKDKIPEYSFLNVSEGVSFNLRENTESSFICSSDFDGNGYADYALLLESSSHEICLFVLNIEGEEISHFHLDCFGVRDENDIELSIRVEAKGKWEAIDEIIQVQHDGITVEDLRESRSKSYFWENEQYKKFLYD
jgi:hypothetical protein